MTPACLTPLAILALAACGHTEQEMAAKEREISTLTTRLRETSDQLQRDATTVDAAKTELDELKQQFEHLKTNASACAAPAPAKPVPRWATSYAR